MSTLTSNLYEFLTGQPLDMNDDDGPATTHIQQLNVQYTGPSEQTDEHQTSTIHYHASSGNGSHSEPQRYPWIYQSFFFTI